LKKTIVFTILFLLIFSSFIFASPIPTNLKYDNYIIYKSSSGYTVLLNTDKPIVIGSFLFYSASNYVLRDGVFVYESSWSADKTFDKTMNIVGSNYDVYDNSGNVFFSQPEVTIQEIIQEETKKILPVLVGKTKTILPTGFGVLSAMLLIVLLTVYFRHFLHRSV